MNASSTVLCVYDTVSVRVTRYKLGLIRPRIRVTLLKGHGSDFSANRLLFEQASLSSIYITVVIRHTRNKFSLNPPRIKTPFRKGQSSDFAVNRPLFGQTS